jgi:hypothetical protein
LSGRALTAGLLALGLAAGAQGSAPQDERPPHETIDRPSRESCGGCHPRELEEWSRSLHAKAWTNANVRNATRGFALLECRPCHSPRSIFETGLDRQPALREFNQADGVHCLSCHGLPDGVAARRTLPDAPCRPIAEPRLLAAEHCYPCHQPTHGAFDEYRTSRAFRRGTRCADCHMPLREDGPGRSHGPHGGLNADFVREALDWEARLEDGRVVVTLTNLTGHRFPGEIPSRSLLVEVRLGDQEPTFVRLRKPNKGEEREDDRLAPDETRELSFPLPEGVTSATVALWFLPLPMLAPEQGFSLGEWSI